jgi:hypothetical protein
VHCIPNEQPYSPLSQFAVVFVVDELRQFKRGLIDDLVTVRRRSA